MSYYGNFRAGQLVRCRFNTVNSSGAPTSLASGAVVVSKDGADVTPSGGVTLTADVGGVVGRNRVVIDLSVDPTTFTAGSEYDVRLSAGTVGGASVVGAIVGEWSIANRAVAADASGRTTLAPTQSYNNTAQTAALPANATQWGGVAVTGMPMPTFAYTTPPTTGAIAAAVMSDVSDVIGVDVLAIKAVTDKLSTTLQGTGPYAFTALAMANAPSGTGASAVSIRQEIDANSTQLAALRTGVAVTDKTGFSLAAAGLDVVKGFGSWSFRQTEQAIAALLMGVRSGVPAAGAGGTITLANSYGTITVDTAGNITSAAITPPA